jgi:hypothetical protein
MLLQSHRALAPVLNREVRGSAAIGDGNGRLRIVQCEAARQLAAGVVSTDGIGTHDAADASDSLFDESSAVDTKACPIDKSEELMTLQSSPFTGRNTLGHH